MREFKSSTVGSSAWSGGWPCPWSCADCLNIARKGLHPDPQAPNDIQTHQEAFRAMLRQSAQDQGQGQGVAWLPGAPAGALGPPPGIAPMREFKSSTVGSSASMLGVPPFIATMLGGATPPTEAEQKRTRIWKTLHTVFAH
jgi:hypothetical protein